MRCAEFDSCKNGDFSVPTRKGLHRLGTIATWGGSYRKCRDAGIRRSATSFSLVQRSQSAVPAPVWLIMITWNLISGGILFSRPAINQCPHSHKCGTPLHRFPGEGARSGFRSSGFEEKEEPLIVGSPKPESAPIGVQFPDSGKPNHPIHKTQARTPVHGIARDGLCCEARVRLQKEHL